MMTRISYRIRSRRLYIGGMLGELKRFPCHFKLVLSRGHFAVFKWEAPPRTVPWAAESPPRWNRMEKLETREEAVAFLRGFIGPAAETAVLILESTRHIDADESDDSPEQPKGE